MYSFGYDFDYNSDIDGLIYNYIIKIKNTSKASNEKVCQKPIYRRLRREDIVYSPLIRKYCNE